MAVIVRTIFAAACLVLCMGTPPAVAAGGAVAITPLWDKVTMTSRTTLSIDVCVYPHIRRGHPLHDKLWKAFSDFEGHYQRILFWFPYPRLTVAELYPPKNGKTSWDFSLIDPIVEDFINSANGRPVVMDFGTVPNWMYTDTPQPIPDDPEQLVWNYYAQKPVDEFHLMYPLGTYGPLSDETVRLIAEYQARVAAWYTQGGFRDEYGVWHESGHNYKIDYWEVLSEPTFERGLSPQDYTRVYDAVVEEVRKIAPEMKFIGLSLGSPRDPEYFHYFLDPANHKPGIPLEMISIHSYASADVDEVTPDKYQHSIFEQVDAYAGIITYVKAIRDRLSPDTRIAINEVGAFLPGLIDRKLFAPIPDSYWNLVAAMSAYHFGRMTELGIDIVNNAELINYPGQTAATSLTSWETGEPNARYWALKLLRDSFGPGDKLVASKSNPQILRPDPGFQIYHRGFVSGSDGKRRILIVNKREQGITVEVDGAKGGVFQVVDVSTEGYPRSIELEEEVVRLNGFAVAVVTLK